MGAGQDSCQGHLGPPTKAPKGRGWGWGWGGGCRPARSNSQVHTQHGRAGPAPPPWVPPVHAGSPVHEPAAPFCPPSHSSKACAVTSAPSRATQLRSTVDSSGSQGSHTRPSQHGDGGGAGGLDPLKERSPSQPVPLGSPHPTLRDSPGTRGTHLCPPHSCHLGPSTVPSRSHRPRHCPECEMPKHLLWPRPGLQLSPPRPGRHPNPAPRPRGFSDHPQDKHEVASCARHSGHLGHGSDLHKARSLGKETATGSPGAEQVSQGR